MLSGILAVAPFSIAKAEDIKDLTAIVFLKGKCGNLMIADEEFSRGCQAKIMNTVYKSGRTGFTFFHGDFDLFTFSGVDNPAIGNRASVSLDRVLLAPGGKEEDQVRLLATGTCTYTNPYAGPSHVNCRAFTKLGTITASFVSDGQEPDITRFD